jgi:hypothetical protein
VASSIRVDLASGSMCLGGQRTMARRRRQRAQQRAHNDIWTCLALLLQAARRASNGVIQFYDTQIPTHTSTTSHAEQQTRTRLCRNETVKPLPPARLLSKQGSRRRSGLVVFPTCSSDYILRPGRGTVSYARSRQLQTSLPWKVGLWSRRVGWV